MVPHTKCIRDKCNVEALFTFKGDNKPLYCFTHKTTSMINIRTKLCKYPNCYTTPSFNYIHIKSPIYCLKHKLNNMINVKEQKCIQPDCTTIASYNYKDEKKYLYCATHKLPNMISIRSLIKTKKYTDNKTQAIQKFINNYDNN